MQASSQKQQIAYCNSQQAAKTALQAMQANYMQSLIAIASKLQSKQVKFCKQIACFACPVL